MRDTIRILSLLLCIAMPTMAYAAGAVTTVAGGFTAPCDGSNHSFQDTNNTAGTAYVRGFQLSTFFPPSSGNNYVYITQASTGYFLWFSFVNSGNQAESVILPSASYVAIPAGDSIILTVYCQGGGAGEGVIIGYYDTSTP